ncbi:MAG TPA: hypothetical protein VGA96_06345 [Fibrella sp.]|jgi:hypothetical protein
MNTLIASLLLASTVSLTTLPDPDPFRQGSKRGQPTKLVQFEVGALVNASGKLRVNVDKQLGGLVYIQLLDRKGYVYFNRTLFADEEIIRLSLDLSHLPVRDYVLKVSNGLEMVTRDVKIATVEPLVPTRTVTLQ